MADTGVLWVPSFARMSSIHIHTYTLHDCIAVVSVRTLSCKLASKPLFSDTSAAKPTVEAVLDLEVNGQILSRLLL